MQWDIYCVVGNDCGVLENDRRGLEACCVSGDNLELGDSRGAITVSSFSLPQPWPVLMRH